MSAKPKIYSFEYYQHIFDLEEKHWWHLGMREIARQMIERHHARSDDLRILDAGCGTGMYLSWLARYSRPNHVLGIDVSWHGIEFCQKRRHTLLSQASVTQLPLKSETFDLVTCNDVLQHLPKDGGDLKALLELHRILKPGGFLFIRSNARPRNTNGQNETDFDFHKYTLDELEQKLSRAGFLVEQATYVNFLPSVYGTLKNFFSQEHKTHSYQGLGIQPPPFKWLNPILYQLLKMEAKYLSSPRRRLPFGHTTVCFAKKPEAEINGDNTNLKRQNNLRAK